MLCACACAEKGNKQSNALIIIFTTGYFISHIDIVSRYSPTFNEKIMKKLHDVSHFSPKSSSSCVIIWKQSGQEVTWVCDSLEWTVKLRACKHGSAHRSRSGEELPAGYNMQPKVEHSLRNIIMMFVTANDSA